MVRFSLLILLFFQPGYGVNDCHRCQAFNNEDCVNCQSPVFHGGDTNTCSTLECPNNQWIMDGQIVEARVVCTKGSSQWHYESNGNMIPLKETAYCDQDPPSFLNGRVTKIFYVVVLMFIFVLSTCGFEFATRRAIEYWGAAALTLATPTKPNSTPTQIKFLVKKFVQEFHHHSVEERRLFVKIATDQITEDCEPLDFLQLVKQCASEEKDAIVWTHLHVGIKIFLIAMNKTVGGVRLSEFMVKTGLALLIHCQLKPAESETQDRSKLRNVALQMIFTGYDRDVVAGMIQYFKECHYEPQSIPEQLRKMVVAFYVRYADMDMEKQPDQDRPSMQKPREIWHREASPCCDHRQILIGALCSSSYKSEVKRTLELVLATESTTAKDLLYAFTACIEECFDMRHAAEEIFTREHDKIKEIVPVRNIIYQEILLMFFRYTSFATTGEEGLITKFIYTEGAYTPEERKLINISKLLRCAQNCTRLAWKAATDENKK